MPHQTDSSPRIVVVFRNDDPSAVSDPAHERRLFDVFEHWNTPQTIGVVPNMQRGSHRTNDSREFARLTSNPAMCDLLREHSRRTGSELALHGFTHQSNRFSKPHRRFWFEFARLPLEEQESMMREGCDIIEEACGQRPRTFIPPWNRMDCTTITACRRVGFEVVSSSIYVPGAEGIIPFGANSCLQDFASHLELARRSEQLVFIHVLLHTPSMNRPEDQVLLEKVLRSVDAEPDCMALTVLDAAKRFPSELKDYNRAGRGVIPFSEEMGSRRGRASLYLRAASRARVSGSLDRAREEARRLYRVGKYSDSIKAARPIDPWVTFLTYAARALAFITVVGTAWLAALIPFSPVVISITGLTVVAALGGMALWRSTSLDTRQEMLTLTIIFVFGWGIGRAVPLW